MERLKPSLFYTLSLQLFSATIFVGLPSFATNLICDEVLNTSRVNWSESFYKRGEELTKVDYKDDKSYLAEIQRSQAFGKVQGDFNRDLDTRIYFTATALPERNGKIPYIDPASKAVFIFFHGSGTMQSSGKNFIGLMNTLASIGYSGLSMDMPFHAEGPIRDQFNDANYFMNWVHSIVKIARDSGKPVFLVGHSFGPEVISEFVYRYPFGVNGGLLLSPAGFNRDLEYWQTNYTDKMRFGGDVPSNRLAGEWAARFSSQTTWNRSARQNDPTIINPSLVLRHLSGDREEYVPAPVGGKNGLPIGQNTYDIAKALRVHFQNLISVIEPNVGHYIFNHVDRLGQPIVLREILALVGESALNEKNLRQQRNDIVSATRNDADQFLYQYATDRIFQAWVMQNYGLGIFNNIHRNRDTRLSRKILVEYAEVKREREKGLGIK